MPDEVPPYDAPEEAFGPDDHPDEASRGACLIDTLGATLEAWQDAHPEVRMSTVVDALLAFIAGTLFHLWQDVERAIPAPPIPWEAFVAGMEERLTALLAQIHDQCRCGACRPPNHC